MDAQKSELERLSKEVASNARTLKSVQDTIQNIQRQNYSM